jgi:hypothetical protein
MTESTLWASTTKALPNNARALFNLANELTKSPRMEDKIMALQYYDKACGIAGDNMFYYNYGCAFTGMAGQHGGWHALLQPRVCICGGGWATRVMTCTIKIPGVHLRGWVEKMKWSSSCHRHPWHATCKCFGKWLLRAVNGH